MGQQWFKDEGGALELFCPDGAWGGYQVPYRTCSPRPRRARPEETCSDTHMRVGNQIVTFPWILVQNIPESGEGLPAVFLDT